MPETLPTIRDVEVDAAERVLSECLEMAQPDGYYRALAESVLDGAREAKDRWSQTVAARMDDALEHRADDEAFEAALGESRR